MNTRLIILAAGQGTRLRPLTNGRPKCMVEVYGKPLLQWQVETAYQAGVKDIVIVRGYLCDTINIPDVKYVENKRYAHTNMVETLFCALKYFSDSIIVSYGDIIFEKKVLERLLNSKSPISVVVDIEWKNYWNERFENPLDDAETLKIDSCGNIIEIGQKPYNFADIDAQYIGLTAYSGEGVENLKNLYYQEKAANQCGKNYICEQRDLSKLFMTDMVQGLISKGYCVSSIPISGGWLEIDSFRDLKLAEQYISRDGEFLRVNR